MKRLVSIGIAAAILGFGFPTGEAGWVSSARAQDYCDALEEKLEDSFFYGEEVLVSDVLDDIDQYDDGTYSFFLEIGCYVLGYDDILVDIEPRPHCGEGSRVTVLGVVDDADEDLGVVIVASRLSCD